MSVEHLSVQPQVTEGLSTTSLTLRQRLLQRLARHANVGQISIMWPDGSRWNHVGAAPGPDAELHLHRDRAVTRLALGGDVGFAESYIDGDWDSPDLFRLLAFGVANLEPMDGIFTAKLVNAFWNRCRHALRANTLKGSRRNIAFHYDLGNEFYSHWLDRTMSYSSALFVDHNEDLDAAQHEKYCRLAEAVGLQQESRVLEIGCGWGGFAETAIRDYGSYVVGLTLSTEQRNFAQERLQKAEFNEQAEIRLQDYRDVSGLFDAVISIEMFEAIGEENWPTYFEKLRSVLRPGGKVGIQVITINEDRYHAYRDRPDFIQKYIFPGGMLPSPEQFEKTATTAGFEIGDRFFFGASYAETLRRWHERFEAQWPAIENLGFDKRFYRMWRYYLAYCEAGFQSGPLNVVQYTLIRS